MPAAETPYRAGFVDTFCETCKLTEIESIIETLLLDETPGSTPSDVETSVRGYGQKWRFQENLYRQSERLSRWLLEEEPAQLAQGLLNTEAIWLLRDQTYYKEPCSEHTPWHQDAMFIPVSGCQFLTLWIPFTPIETNSDSPLEYWCSPYPAAHLLSGNSSVGSFLEQSRDWALMGWEHKSTLGLGLGSCSFHDGWTIHGSSVQGPIRSRRAFVVVYGVGEGTLHLRPRMNCCPDELREEVHLLRSALHHSCFATLKEGDPVPSHQNPWIRT